MRVQWYCGTRVEILIATLDHRSYPLVNVFLPAAARRGWVKGTLVRIRFYSLDKMDVAVQLDDDYPEVAYREFNSKEAESKGAIRPICILDELAEIA